MFNVSLYIDPATTSYIIQIAAGVLVALGTCVGIFWNKITRLFRKKKGDDVSTKKASAPTQNKDVVVKAEDLLDD